MIWAFLLMNLCAVTTAAYLRYVDGPLAYAAPVSLEARQWQWLIGASASLAAVAMLVGWRSLRADRLRAIGELMVFPAAFVFVWSCLPARMSDYGLLDWLGIAGLALVIVLLMWRGRDSFAQWGLTGRNFKAALLRSAAPTAVMVGAVVTAAIFVGTELRPKSAAMSLLGYPFYALVQLMVFQVFLVQRLRRLSDSTAAVIIVAGGMFALLHWPNALVMAASGAAAAVWTWVYLSRPNVYALAISMAIAATTFTHVLPRSLTNHMRVGPIYVERLERKADAAARTAASPHGWPGSLLCPTPWAWGGLGKMNKTADAETGRQFTDISPDA